MQRIIILLAIIIMISMPLKADGLPTVPTYDEQREILMYLKELPLVRAERDLLHEGLNECRENVSQWQGAFTQCQDNSAALLRSKDQEIQLYKEQSGFYEAAYRSLLQRKSWFCKVKPYITLGVLRCH